MIMKLALTETPYPRMENLDPSTGSGHPRLGDQPVGPVPEPTVP